MHFPIKLSLQAAKIRDSRGLRSRASSAYKLRVPEKIIIELLREFLLKLPKI